jgi:DDE superfamily endonuclease
MIFVRDRRGDFYESVPTMSPWYALYIDCPDVDDRHFQKVFRNRFRLPYKSFIDLLEYLKLFEQFQRWNSKTATGEPSSPIALLLLGVLRVLGCAWTFDDLQEVTSISRENHRQFMHVFIAFASTHLFEKYVVSPKTADDVKDYAVDYAIAGLHGAIGSTDGTHIPCDKVRYSLNNHHCGFKMPYTARSYNLTCNNRRKILASTRGHPGRMNDKTMIWFDRLANDLKNGKILDDHFFELYTEDANGNVAMQRYRGAWLLVDNGYLPWSVTMPPFKTSNYDSEIRWSHMLESMRKDVECTFGILKGRWRILKTGIRMHGVESTDRVWLTCCALHNMLLEVDGLDTDWESVDMNDWRETQDQDGDMRDIPFALRRLHSPHALAIRDYYLHLQGVGDELDRDEEDTIGVSYEDAQDEDGCVRLRLLSFHDFRKHLTEHFRICKAKGEIAWPKHATDPQV